MSSIESKIQSLIKGDVDQSLQKATEGLKLGVIHKGHRIAEVNWGKVYKYYDLASLTKIIFTTSQIMRGVDEGKIFLNDKVAKFLPDIKKNKIQIKTLLNHTAGLQAWNGFYEKMQEDWDFDHRWKQTLDWIDKSAFRKSDKSLYSDLDFMLLGHVLEAAYGKSLIKIWEELKPKFGSTSLHFCSENTPLYKKKLYAPTEICPWRKKTLRGEVHDDNTWSFGGVAPHAGLFGRLDDVMTWAEILRKSILGQKGFCSKEVAQRFTKRSTTVDKGDWALGFMMPSQGRASCGQFFSPQSIGHTGFVGTSFWWDPKVDLAVIILSNRVHPTRNNNLFRKMRPLLHDIVYKAVIQEEK